MRVGHGIWLGTEYEVWRPNEGLATECEGGNGMGEERLSPGYCHKLSTVLLSAAHWLHCMDVAERATWTRLSLQS